MKYSKAEEDAYVAMIDKQRRAKKKLTMKECKLYKLDELERLEAAGKVSLPYEYQKRVDEFREVYKINLVEEEVQAMTPSVVLDLDNLDRKKAVSVQEKKVNFNYKQKFNKLREQAQQQNQKIAEMAEKNNPSNSKIAEPISPKPKLPSQPNNET